MIEIQGRVLRGNGYGRHLGFPTANLDRRQLARRRQKVKLGVYAGTARIGVQSREYLAGIVVGPIDKRGLPKLEAHLLGFRGNLYGQQLTLRLDRFLRPFRKYNKEPSLRRAIAQDLKQVKKTIKL